MQYLSPGLIVAAIVCAGALIWAIGDRRRGKARAPPIEPPPKPPPDDELAALARKIAAGRAEQDG